MMNNRSTAVSILCAVLLLFAAFQANAQEDPIQMLNGVTTRVMSALKENRPELKRNPSKIYGVVNRYILPYADFPEMARWVVGRNAWQQANEATKKAFIEEFKGLVVRTYAQSLLKYNEQTIEFAPLRSGDSNKERVQVTSYIRDGGKKPLRIDYRLLRQGGSWKVYDIIIEGVSLMQGYRAQFADDVQRGGVAYVVEKLRGHNRQGAKQGMKR